MNKCPACNGTGLVETKERVYRRCNCTEIQKLNGLWEKSGISFNDFDKSFKNFEAWNKDIKIMKDIATSYYISYERIKTEKENSIMLCGNPGCGKTHLIIALANNFIKNKEIEVIYMPYRDAVTKLKQNITDGEQYQILMDKYKNCKILLIDDLFKGKVTESDINLMFEIINHRYLKRLPVMISTEFTIDDLLEFDEAIGSRIFEMTKNYLCEITGRENNYRLNAYNLKNDQVN
ncbi:ATP-binding protein [Clostridium baratii]|uniref:ATP-binding protein n=1 Tax=Clostridium baratii TaxID=1561 RepID=UPI0030CD9083